MLPIINLTSHRNFSIRSFEEDKIATLSTHKGLRYDGKVESLFKFSGNFYLTNAQNKLIESFSVEIYISNNYPNTFPLVFLTDNKIEKTNDYHVNDNGTICVEHTYVANSLAKRGLRLFDFVNYYLTKYFSWVLVKKYGNAEELKEWAHYDKGTIQVYETLLDITDKNIIRQFLENYCKASKVERNDKCYCGSGKKLKYCHYEAALFLNDTSKDIIKKDIELFL